MALWEDQTPGVKSQHHLIQLSQIRVNQSPGKFSGSKLEGRIIELVSLDYIESCFPQLNNEKNEDS